MERSEYSLLSLSVWFIASQITSGWFEIFASALAVGWLLAWLLALYNEREDRRRTEIWRR